VFDVVELASVIIPPGRGKSTFGREKKAGGGLHRSKSGFGVGHACAIINAVTTQTYRNYIGITKGGQMRPNRRKDWRRTVFVILSIILVLSMLLGFVASAIPYIF
jgi:hypothetical protein